MFYPGELVIHLFIQFQTYLPPHNQGFVRHWCLAVNLRIGIYNGEMVFNRLFGNGWSDLDDFSLDMNI